MDPKKSNPMERVKGILRQAGPGSGSTPREHPEEDQIWALLDGELEPAAEDALADHLTACVQCRQTATRIREARREVAREELWPLERVRRMIAEKSAAGVAGLDPRAALAPVIRLGRWVMNVLSVGLEGLEAWPPAAPALVRGAAGPQAQQWAGRFGGARLAFRLGNAPGGAMPSLHVELLEGGGAGYELELVGEPDLLLESCPLSALPVCLELPRGRAFLNLVSGSRRWTLLAWEMEGDEGQ